MVSIVRISDHETKGLVKINVYKVDGHTIVLHCVCDHPDGCSHDNE